MCVCVRACVCVCVRVCVFVCMRLSEWVCISVWWIEASILPAAPNFNHSCRTMDIQPRFPLSRGKEKSTGNNWDQSLIVGYLLRNSMWGMPSETMLQGCSTLWSKAFLYGKSNLQSSSCLWQTHFFSLRKKKKLSNCEMFFFLFLDFKSVLFSFYT